MPHTIENTYVITLTKAQDFWLKKLRAHGFVEAGTWGRGQRNRPLRTLVEKGLAVEGFGPKGCMLQVHGFSPIGNYPINEPISETLTGVVYFMGGR